MTQLFISLYLDEDINVLVSELLQAQGFVATTTLKEGQLGKSDTEQLIYAIQKEMVMLTHNRKDFELLHHEYLAKNKTHWGIILAVRYPPYQLVKRLMRILNSISGDEMINQLIYV